MRMIFAALTATLALATGPALAFGTIADFPTLTWPQPTVDLPTQSCLDATTLTPVLCPAPSR